VVQSFDVYIVEGAGSSIDVIEVMTVTSWADWEAVRDHAAELKPVVDRFAQLVDEDTVVTHFTRRSVASKEI
jgi:hypothetical protein